MPKPPPRPLDLATLRAQLRAAPTTSAPDEALQRVGGIIDLLDTPADSSPEVQAVAALAHAAMSEALCTAGDPRSALEHALQAEDLAERSGDQCSRARARLAVGHVCYVVGHLGEAEHSFERVLELDGIDPDIQTRARTNQAAILRATGRLEEAAQAFDALLPQAEQVHPARGAALLINAASCYHQVDRAPDGRRALDRARALLPTAGRPDLWTWVDAIAAWVALADGDPLEAVQHARAALAPDRPGSNLHLRSSAARALTKAALATGMPASRDEALLRLEAVLAQAEAAGLRGEAAEVHESLATLREARGDLAAAVHHLRRSREHEAERAGHDRRVRGEQEALRLEVVRMTVEADAHRARREELAQANRALLAADAARGRLVRTLAHDLRSPLTNVLVTVDLMDAADPAGVERARTVISESVERMVAMLEAAMSPREAVAVDPVDLQEVARTTVASFDGLARRKGQHLVVQPRPAVLARVDPVPVGRLLDNLVSNAIKYGPEGGEISIEIVTGRRGAQILVVDEGPGFPGIDPSEGLLFGHQLSSRASGGEASWGLGLHTVYQLLAELGGILAIGNRPEGGAIVRVTLPLA